MTSDHDSKEEESVPPAKVRGVDWDFNCGTCGECGGILASETKTEHANEESLPSIAPT